MCSRLRIEVIPENPGHSPGFWAKNFFPCRILRNIPVLFNITMQVTPYKEDQKSKKEQVADMFNNISRRYDLLNHVLSFGIDIYWRKQAIRLLKKENPSTILDIATGTGDFAIEALASNPQKVVGVDIAENMLEIGRKKIKKKGLQDKIELIYGDSEKLPFPENNFDAVIVSYGVRNFENLEKGLSEMFRVMKPNGTLVIVEFSKPSGFPFKQLYNFYFHYILPVVGRLVSKDRAAYTYLPESVNAFPDGARFLDYLKEAGFKNTGWIPQTFGISSIYTGKKSRP
jgi:demethylmenaquinone methyltransferase / 2-methoxy-6-polyprenyl-1,4-benzoquinol methylase